MLTIFRPLEHYDVCLQNFSSSECKTYLDCWDPFRASEPSLASLLQVLIGVDMIDSQCFAPPLEMKLAAACWKSSNISYVISTCQMQYNAYNVVKVYHNVVCHFALSAAAIALMHWLRAFESSCQEASPAPISEAEEAARLDILWGTPRVCTRMLESMIVFQIDWFVFCATSSAFSFLFVKFVVPTLEPLEPLPWTLNVPSTKEAALATLGFARTSVTPCPLSH